MMYSDHRHEPGTTKGRPDLDSDDDSHISSNGNEDTGSALDSLHNSLGNVNGPNGAGDMGAAQGSFGARCLRLLVITALAAMTIAAPIVVYRIAHKNEADAFEGYFESLAANVVATFRFNIERKLDAMDSFAVTITSYSLASGSVHPLLTLPNFDLLASNTLALADALSLFLAPLVSQPMRATWETYSVENQGWIEEASNRLPPSGSILGQELERKQASARRLQNLTSDSAADGEIIPFIHEYNENGDLIRVDAFSDHSFPVWQTSPVAASIANMDLLSDDTFATGLETMMSTKYAVLGNVVNLESSNNVALLRYAESISTDLMRPIDDSDNLETEKSTTNTTGLEPVSVLFYPIFSGFDETSVETVVSGLGMTIFWGSNLERVSETI